MKTTRAAILLLSALFLASHARAQVMGGVMGGTSGSSDSGQVITPSSIVDKSSTTTPLAPILNVQDDGGHSVFQVQEDSAVVVNGATIPNGGATVVIKSSSTVAATPVLVIQDGNGNVLVRIFGDGGIQPYPRTIAQLQALVPFVTGEQFFCSDCTLSKMVVSTGTAAGNVGGLDGDQFK